MPVPTTTVTDAKGNKKITRGTFTTEPINPDSDYVKTILAIIDAHENGQI